MKKFMISLLALATIGTFTVSCDDKSNEPGTDDTTPGDTTPGDTTPGDSTPTTGEYVHKIIVEDATGSWCGYCPRVVQAINEVKEHSKGDQIIPIALHSNDPMSVPHSEFLIEFFASDYGLTGFPFALINRDVVWEGDQVNNKEAILTLIEKSSPIGIKIASDLSTNGGSITVDFNFKKGYQGLKYSIFVLENGVISTQNNGTDYFGGPGDVTDFVHNDVLIKAAGNPKGNLLGDVNKDEEVTKSKSVSSLSLTNNNLSKVDVVVFVTDADGKVLNAQIAHANETKDFEMN